MKLKKKVKIALTAALMLIGTTSSFASVDKNFSDLDNHWSKANVMNLVEKGVIKGYEDGTFKPDGVITVAEFVKMLMINNHIELGEKGSNWHDEYINGARELGLIQGGEFENYNLPITRVEITRLIDRALNLETGVSQDFKDSNTFNGLGSAINRVSTVGIISGYDDGTFRPYDYATRGEASTVIKRVNDYLDGKTITVNVELIPDYNSDGSWTDEWFLDNVKSMTQFTNYSDYGDGGSYKFEGRKMIVASNDSGKTKIIPIEDEVMNERMFKMLKYFTQKAYETNRYARVRHVTGTAPLIIVDLSSNYRGRNPGDIQLGFPLDPDGYMNESFQFNLDAWNIQRVDIRWSIGKLFDDRSIPREIADDDILGYNYLIKNDYILEPYATFLEDSFKLIYGGDDYKEILDYVIKERTKELKLLKVYENKEQVIINGIKIHNENGLIGSQAFLSEIK